MSVITFYLGGYLLLVCLLPLAGVLGGIIAAAVKKDRGWYLLSVVCGGILIWILSAVLRAVILGSVLGYGLAVNGILPVPN